MAFKLVAYVLRCWRSILVSMAVATSSAAAASSADPEAAVREAVQAIANCATSGFGTATNLAYRAATVARNFKF